MKVPVGEWENVPNAAFTSRVAGIGIVVTPNNIAKYLKLTRPPPESINYPIKD